MISSRIFRLLPLVAALFAGVLNAAQIEVAGKHLRSDGSIYDFQVVDGDALSPGDRFQIIITADETTYYSIIYVSRDGDAAQIFPPAGQAGRLAVGARTYIPGVENFFTLDVNGGRELMFIATSPNRITNLSSVLKTASTMTGSNQVYDYLRKRLPNVQKLEITNTGKQVSSTVDQVSSTVARDFASAYSQNPWPASVSQDYMRQQRSRRADENSIPEEVRRRTTEVRSLLKRPAGATGSSSLRTVEVHSSDTVPSTGQIRRDTAMLIAEEERQEEELRLRQERLAEEERLQQAKMQAAKLAQQQAEAEAQRLHEQRLEAEKIEALRRAEEEALTKALEEKRQAMAAAEAEAKRQAEMRAEVERREVERRRLEEERLALIRQAEEAERQRQMEAERREIELRAQEAAERKEAERLAAEMERLRQLEQERLEAERMAAERARQEEEARLAAEAENERQRRMAAEQQAAEEAARLEAERQALAAAEAEAQQLQQQRELAEQQRLERERAEEEARLVAEQRTRELDEQAQRKADIAAEEERLKADQQTLDERLRQHQEQAAADGDKEEGKGLFGQLLAFVTNDEKDDQAGETGSADARARSQSTTVVQTDSTGAVILNENQNEARPVINNQNDEAPKEAVVVLQAAERPAPKKLSAPAPVRSEPAAKEDSASGATQGITRDLYGEVASAIVSIKTANEPDAAGFILDSKGHILTAWHVINGVNDIDVNFMAVSGAPRSYKARVIKFNKFQDLALLQLINAPEGIQPITVGPNVLPDAGAKVRVFGQKGGEVWATDDAVITRIAPHFTWFSKDNVIHRGEVLQVDLPPEGKEIGSLVTSMDYQMLGIKSFSGSQTGRTYAVSVRVIREFVESKGQAAE